MTGADPFAVREIEQIIQLNNNIDFKNEQLRASTSNIDQEGSATDTKKNKVIFSVKKEHTNSQS